MNILFLGDIVGKSGREIVSSLLNSIKHEYDIDLTIANGENAAHGKGITSRIYTSLINEGIDYITMGNHAYSKSEINDHMYEMTNLIIPYNHVSRASENYFRLINYKGLKMIICNILGEAMIPQCNQDPFSSFNDIVDKTKYLKPDFYFVDLHAETTATKILFAHNFKNIAKIVVGTHTHVQTADERMISNCAYISDVGMCGAYDSIIGRDIQECIDNQIYKQPTKYKVASDEAILCGVVINVDEVSKNPTMISRIQIRPY